MSSTEINLDGIVGPTHSYAGLSYGNIASMSHKASVSNPRAAALQGLEKMKFLFDLGLPQAVLPPHERPHMPTLRALGFAGTDAAILEKVHRTDPTLLAMVSSASAMWTANAATVSPSADSADGKVHFTPANLASTFHRSLETATTRNVLKKIFADRKRFVHHDPLPCGSHFADEGAANHTRLWITDLPGMSRGLQIFTHGRDVSDQDAEPMHFPARQTLQASQAIARLHQTHPMPTLFFKQTPQAIDAGAFHNDVVCVGHRNVLLIHQDAWEVQHVALRQSAEVFQMLTNARLHVIEIGLSEISLAQAIKSYLFNSQVVTLPDDSIALIAPIECREDKRVRDRIDKIIAAKNPINAVHYVDVRQSMNNGGGPACLRLRVVLTDKEQAAMHQGVRFSDALYKSLRGWVEKHYREKLTSGDLGDPKLLEESRTALDELTKLLDLGSIYEFQK
jgi:succinylarginine dihydrolase